MSLNGINKIPKSNTEPTHRKIINRLICILYVTKGEKYKED